MELKEQIEAKRAEYVNQKQQAQNDINSAQMRLIMFDGAIQDCDYWLTQLDKPPVETPAAPAT